MSRNVAPLSMRAADASERAPPIQKPTTPTEPFPHVSSSSAAALISWIAPAQSRLVMRWLASSASTPTFPR